MYSRLFLFISKMKFVKEVQSIDLLNFEEQTGEKKHGPLLPDTLRCVCVGRSNSGKTSTLLSLLLSPNGLKYAGVYVYSKSIGQPKYKYLEQIFCGLKPIVFHMFSNAEQVIKLDELKNDSICIFDDVSLENQNIIRDIYSRSRHKGIDCFYLSQSYKAIPKHLIRDNLNFLIIFPQDNINLKSIFDEHVGSDMSFEQFKKMCKLCWDKNYGFLVINKDNEIPRGRYKFLFDTIILPDGFHHGEGASCVGNGQR